MSTGRVAVYLCHCGHNIAATVDVPEVAASLEGIPGVTMVRHYPYLCSRPGQELIRKDLSDGLADRVVVAACSPRMHETTFRKAVAAEGVNPYLFTHVNVREQCSWVHPEKAEATAKAKELVRAGLARVRLQEELTGSRAAVTRCALVLGAGVAGLSAAQQLAAQGIEVVLVEKSNLLGGRSLDVGRSFPDGGEVQPWLASLVEKVEADNRIETIRNARVDALTGTPGSFAVTLTTPMGQTTREAGAVILATGFDPYKPGPGEGQRPELGYGSDPRIVTQEELETLLRKNSGPLTVEGREPRTFAFLQCIGSRDRTAGGQHCSRVCCMTSVRQAGDLLARGGDVEAHVLYTDLRAYARGAEEDYEAAGRAGVLFRRGAASEIYKRGDSRIVRFEDTLGGGPQELAADMVVLACGIRPRFDADETGRVFGASRGPDGFYLEAHPKLRPAETNVDGVYLAGTCQGPKTIDEAVTSGRAAAAKAALMLLAGSISVDPATAFIDPERCAGCGLCAALCPASAIEVRPHRAPRRFVHAALCKGCGTCQGVCPSSAASLKHHRDPQVYAEIDVLTGA